MIEFQTPVDIGNRALQHCGAELMDAVQGFAEGTKRARQVSFAYGKLRRAELQGSVWTFSTKRVILRPVDTNTFILTPAMWSVGVTYFLGSIVSSENNSLWISRTQNNLNNQPENSLTWEPYFGPMTVMLYDSSQSYSAGELVYVPVGDGTARVYLSLENANSDNPATATAWSSTVTYNANDVVTYLSVAYMSLLDLNAGHTPNTSPTFWTTTFTAGTGSLKWRQIGGAGFPSGVTITPLKIIYPIGTGPASQASLRNVFRLPSGFLRLAPQDPKAGATSLLGGPSGLFYNDWELESGYIVSQEVGPIMVRFVADMNDVTLFHDLFCEGLAARIALEVCEPLTQSTTKLQLIRSAYDKFMSRAITVNAIEVGSVEPPEDDLLAVRL